MPPQTESEAFHAPMGGVLRRRGRVGRWSAAALAGAVASLAIGALPAQATPAASSGRGQLQAGNPGGQLSVGMMPAGSPDAVHRGARVRTGRSAAGPVNTQYGPDLASYQHPNGQPV
ncbi:MAG TPA: hypothetical protein VGN54_10025, partial [Mycobacteriales bacterium]|nr:hypothetical protein [Mycobacteriales bacterium]